MSVQLGRMDVFVFRNTAGMVNITTWLEDQPYGNLFLAADDTLASSHQPFRPLHYISRNQYIVLARPSGTLVLYSLSTLHLPQNALKLQLNLSSEGNLIRDV